MNCNVFLFSLTWWFPVKNYIHCSDFKKKGGGGGGSRNRYNVHNRVFNSYVYILHENGFGDIQWRVLIDIYIYKESL